MKKNNNDFPLRSAAKEIKMSFTLTAVVDLVLGCIMLFAPAHVTQLLCMLVGAGITIYGLFNVLSLEVELDEDAVTRYGINNLPHDHDAQLQKAIELLGGTPVLTTATPDEANAAEEK